MAKLLTLGQYLSLINILNGHKLSPDNKNYKSFLRRELITKDGELTEKGKSLLNV